MGETFQTMGSLGMQSGFMGGFMQTTESLGNMMRAGSNFFVAIGLAIAAIVALAQCFFGFKLMRLWFALCGFFLGVVSAVAVFTFVVDVAEPGPIIAAALICGVLGAFLLYRVYLVGVFLTCASLTTLLFLVLLGIENWALAVSALCGLVVGILGVKFVRPWVIACTGLSGGMTAGPSILMLMGVGNGGLCLLAGAVVSVLGILFQWKTTGGRKRRQAAAGAAPGASAPPAAPSAPVAPPAGSSPAPGGAAGAALLEKEAAAPAIAPRGKKPIALDKKQLFILLAGAAGLALIALVAILALSGGRADGEAPEEMPKSGYEDAWGNDVLAGMLWLDGVSEVIEYVEEEDAAAAIVGTPDNDRTLINGQGQAVSRNNDRLEYVGLVDGELWFLRRNKDWSKIGFINSAGEEKIDLIDSSTLWLEDLHFSEGLCPIYNHGSQFRGGSDGWGVIDKTGAMVIPFTMDYDSLGGVGAFHGGHAIVRRDQGNGFDFLYGLIDTSGNEVIPCEYQSLSHADDEVLIAKDGTGSYGAVDVSGETVLPFTYSKREDVARALGIPLADDKGPIPAAVMDAYPDCTALGGGIYSVCIWDEEQAEYFYGLVDDEAQVILEPLYLDIRAADEPGLFRVTDASHTFYCDWTGRQRTPEFSSMLESFCNSPRVVRYEGRWGALPHILTEAEAQEFEERRNG